MLKDQLAPWRLTTLFFPSVNLKRSVVSTCPPTSSESCAETTLSMIRYPKLDETGTFFTNSVHPMGAYGS